MGLAENYAKEWAGFLKTLPDGELLATARDYLWLAEFGPHEGRDTFSTKRDRIVAEVQERGLNSELAELRRKLAGESPIEQKEA